MSHSKHHQSSNGKLPLTIKFRGFLDDNGYDNWVCVEDVSQQFFGNPDKLFSVVLDVVTDNPDVDYRMYWLERHLICGKHCYHYTNDYGKLIEAMHRVSLGKED